MEYGLGTTIVSLAFLAILLMIYATKEKMVNLENRIFTYLTRMGLILAIVTILYAYCLNKFEIFWINIILWRLYVFSIIAFFQLLVMYLIVLLENYKNKTLKELWGNNLLCRILFFVFGAIQVIYLIIPHNKLFEVFDKHKIVYTTPALSVIIACMSLTVIIFTTILTKKYKEKLDKETIKNSLIIAYNTLFIILQIVFPSISIYPFAVILITTIIYLSFSNPDIEMSKELVKAKDSIKTSSKTKTDFLSNVTSEIKTPVSYITSICTNLENLDTYNVDEVKKVMQQVILSGNNLLDIVNNVLDISKIESGNTGIIETEYKIKDLIDNVVGVAKSKIGSKPVTLDVKLSPTLATSYSGDASKIYQAVLNILTNAAKYTEVGKITFEVTNTKVALGEKLLFKVADTGNGIKTEDQAKLFVKGERLESSIENEIEGSGYGLAITKEYLDLIDGKIWFESEYRVGSTFYIEITQKVVDETILKDTTETNTEIITNIDCSGLVALVLDDNKLNVKVIKRLLERYGFKVVSVSSGQECIYKVKSEEHFDIVFMDQVMEDMTGTDTMKALRGLEGYKIPPLVLLTANAVAGMRKKYIEEGFDDYIPKPITTPNLEELLNKYFKKTN